MDSEPAARATSTGDGGSSEGGGSTDLIGRHRRLVRRTALVSGLTLVSRVLGFVREILSAALFGDRSAIYDAFVTAWRVPNLFRRFLGEGALATSFQTAMTEAEGRHGEEAGRRLFLETLGLLTTLLIALAAVTMGALTLLPDAMPFTGWRWLGADPEPVRELCVRVMPFVILACLTALAGGALQVRGHFAAPAWAPAVLNLVWIAALVALATVYGFGRAVEGFAPDPVRHLAMARWLAWGVLLAGLVQLLVHVPALRRHRLLPGRSGRGGAPAAAAGVPRAGGVLRRAAPLALGAAVYQINVMIDGLMAEGLLADGGPTLHYYANRVQQFPMALVAVAATSAVFPALQAHGRAGDRAAVRALTDRTQRAIVFVALPASVGLAVLARPVIGASFEHGAFGPEGVARASAALRWLCVAILPAGAVGLAARTYYALGDFRTPVRVSVAMLALNVVLNAAFVAGWGMDVDGLALSTAVTSWGNLALLAPGIARLAPAGERTPIAGPAGRMLLGAAGCGAAAVAVQSLAAPALGRAATLPLSIVAGIAVYALATLLLGVPEAREALHRLTRRGRGGSSSGRA